jgi:hypothetical protein
MEKNIYKIGKELFITSDEEIKEGDYFIAYSVTNDKKPFISCASEYKERKEDKGKIILTTDQDLIKDGIQAIDDEFLEWFVKNPSCESVEVDKTIPCNFDGLDSVRQDKFLELFYKSELFDEIKYNDVFDWSVNEGKDFLKLYPTFKIIIPKEASKQSTKDRIMSETSEETKQKARDYGNSLVTKTETLEEAARSNYKKLYEGEPLTQDVPIDAFINGAKWQQERSYSEEDMQEAFNVGFNVGYNDETSPSYLTFEQWFEQFKKK